MTSVGWATLDVIPSFKGLSRELDRGTAGPMRAAGIKGGTDFGDAAGRSAGSRFGSVFSAAAKASMLGLAGAGALAFKIGADSIGQASDLGESLNAVNVTYGKQARAVRKLGRESAKSLGLSNSEFNGLAVRFSAFATQISGGEGRKVVGTLDDLTTRAADFASVMNLEVGEAAELFQSGLAGETEPLRKYGLDLSAAAVTAHAYAEGIAEAGTQLTESQKVQARYSLLMKDTAKTQGDFANTSDSLANRQRILNARWDDARAKLGKGLLPIVEDLVGVILDDGIPAFERFSDWIVEDGIPAFKDIAKFARNAGNRVGDLIGFFKDLPDPAKYSGLAAILGGGAALKLRGGGGGALGTAGKAFGLAKPVPVFVTNKGFGAGGGTGGAVVADGDGKKRGGRANGAAALIGSVLSPMLIDQLIKELRYPVDELNRIDREQKRTPLVFERQEEAVTFLDAAQKKAEGFGETLDIVGAKRVEPLFAVPGLAKGREGLAEFIRLQIDAGKPVTPYINTTSIERAIALARTLDASLPGNSNPNAGVDNGAGYMSGGTGTNGRAPTIGTVNIQAHDYNDFLTQTQRRTQQAGLGGFN